MAQVINPDKKIIVVARPTSPQSELADICFETTLRNLLTQARGGGFDETKLYAVYPVGTGQLEAAKRTAQKLLKSGGYHIPHPPRHPN